MSEESIVTQGNILSTQENIASDEQTFEDNVKDCEQNEFDEQCEQCEQNQGEQCEHSEQPAINEYFVSVPPDVNDIRVNKLYILVSKYGYSGTFLEREHAEIMKEKYPEVQFIIVEFPQIRNVKNQTVYVVVDKNDMPYYVGDKNTAIQKHLELFTIENTYYSVGDDFGRFIGFDEYAEFKMGVHPANNIPAPRILSEEELAVLMRKKMSEKNEKSEKSATNETSGQYEDLPKSEDTTRTSIEELQEMIKQNEALLDKNSSLFNINQ